MLAWLRLWYSVRCTRSFSLSLLTPYSVVCAVRMIIIHGITGWCTFVARFSCPTSRELPATFRNWSPRELKVKSSEVVPHWRGSPSMSKRQSEVLCPHSSNTWDLPVNFFSFRFHPPQKKKKYRPQTISSVGHDRQSYGLSLKSRSPSLMLRSTELMACAFLRFILMSCIFFPSSSLSPTRPKFGTQFRGYFHTNGPWRRDGSKRIRPRLDQHSTKLHRQLWPISVRNRKSPNVTVLSHQFRLVVLTFCDFFLVLLWFVWIYDFCVVVGSAGADFVCLSRKSQQ